MARDIEDTTTNERGDESHPAFGMIGVSRGSQTPGSVLFDSDILHSHTLRLRIHTASRKRDLHHDWIHAEKHLIEVEISEAQWASFVSTPNSGDGTPCTIRYQGYETVPGLPHDPRLAHSLQETREAAHAAFDDIRAARDAYEAVLAVKGGARERNDALNKLHYAIEHATSNVDYASKSLNEHTENVVARARADIEAFVIVKAHQLGIDPGELGSDTLALGRGE